MTASTMPIMPTMLNASPNMTHAMMAVVGGVRYNRLVTCVAALFRIRANSRKIAPIDSCQVSLLAGFANRTTNRTNST